MLDLLKEEENMTQTENGAAAYRSTKSACLDLFATCGALRHAYASEISKKFIRAYTEDPDSAMKILFYARDIRGGLGERNFFRVIIRELAFRHPLSIQKNLKNIPEYGRFDDLLQLLDTPCETALGEYIKEQLQNDLQNAENGKDVSLLAKWLPSINASGSQKQAKQICRLIHMKEKEYRQTLSFLRKKINIVETHLCNKDFSFDYEKLPSKALLQYRNAFQQNDGERYQTYIEKVQNHQKKMNTSTLFPYELIRAAKQSPEELYPAIDTAWNTLPDYTDGRNALAVIDGSGSMYWNYQNNSPRPIDIAISLGLYFAERNKGKFANHFITFSETPRLVQIKGNSLHDKVEYCMSYDECANTNIAAVFALILKTAVKYNLPQSEMPELIYIISDMEFDEAATNPSDTPFKIAQKYYEKHGYRLPQLVFWNVCARNNQFPVDMDEKGVALFSGASPILFRQAMSCAITPFEMMKRILSSERYSKICA